MAYTIMWRLFGAMVISEIVIYQKVSGLNEA